MNKDTYEKIRASTAFLTKYYELDETDQAWIYTGLDKTFQSTIEMIDLITNRQLTYKEIAKTLGINFNTVTQKINALIEGGFPIEADTKKAFYQVGRKRKSVSRKV